MKGKAGSKGSATPFRPRIPGSYGAREVGGFEPPLVGLEHATLLAMLPARLQSHPAAPRFVDCALDAAACWANIAADVPTLTVAEQRDQLRAIEVAANRMQNELQPLQGASDAFKTLDTDFRYLARRAREGEVHGLRRPVVPELPADVPELPALLARIEQDLQTLRLACNHTAGKMAEPARSTSKFHERELVRAVAEHYRQHFGKLPPQRDWFADAVIAELARAAGLTIGRNLVADVVAGMK